MNKLFIIGNLTKDPETRSVNGRQDTVCNFTVAVNRRGRDGETDFFRVSAWNKLGEICQQHLTKGRKVAVGGRVSVESYQASNGENRATLNVIAEDVEFLSGNGEKAEQKQLPAKTGYVEVTDENLPF
jgi:single-strand DNA-binding protein